MEFFIYSILTLPMYFIFAISTALVIWVNLRETLYKESNSDITLSSKCFGLDLLKYNFIKENNITGNYLLSVFICPMITVLYWSDEKVITPAYSFFDTIMVIATLLVLILTLIFMIAYLIIYAHRALKFMYKLILRSCIQKYRQTTSFQAKKILEELQE